MKKHKNTNLKKRGGKMKRIYDDYDPMYKDLEKRVGLKLVREPSNPMSPWGFSHLISTISTSYYKIELIDSIKTAINNKISPENIFILSGSFKLYESYRDLNSFSLNTNLTKLYYIGDPVSIFPNKDLFTLNLLFKFFRRIKRLFALKGGGLFTIDHLKDSYEELKKKDVGHAIDNLVGKAKQQYREKYREKIIKQETVADFDLDVDKLKKAIISEYKKFSGVDENYGFAYVAECLKENEEIVREDKQANENEKKRVMDEYYLNFFKRFSRIARPVIGIYHKENEQVEILCRNNFHSRVDNKVFLDIKEVSHKSPLVIDMTALVSLGFLVLTHLTIIKQQKELHELTKSQQEELHKLKKKYLDEEFKWKRELGDIEQLIQLEGFFEDSLRKMKNHFIKSELKALYEKIKDRADRNMANNRVEVDNIKIGDISKRK
jgi:hypothetical protein